MAIILRGVFSLKKGTVNRGNVVWQSPISVGNDRWSENGILCNFVNCTKGAGFVIIIYFGGSIYEFICF